MKHWSSLFLIFLSTLSLSATAQSSDNEPSDNATISTNIGQSPTLHRRFTGSKTFEVLHVGVPLVATGLMLAPANDEFKALRDSYCSGSHTSVDDYLQYAPAAAMVALKAAGVESRSSWGRMLTSDALSVALLTLATNGLKMTTNVGRPDTGANNSFPSGHTATAFMTATMLHKEYGAESKWYSIGAYTAATATGLMRVTNNRHWMRDIIVGAGIGILATETGYLLADWIFGDHGINGNESNYADTSWQEIDRPSSIGLYLGSVNSLGEIEEGVTIGTGSKVGFEGAYFFNKYVGVGGRFAISNAPIEREMATEEEELDAIETTLSCVAAYPISRRLRLAAKVLAGVVNYDNATLYSGTYATVGTGVSIDYLANRHFAMRGFCDFDATYITTLSQPRLNPSATFGFAGSIIF
ncbi:MAG: phosphatase PAP2 family protein [Rikenellaceae bacterium]